MQKLVEKLDDYRPDQVEEIKAMQKSLKQASLKKNLANHPAMKLLLDTLRKREQGYNIILTNKEDLPDVKRQAYFARRAEVRFILSFFDTTSSMNGIEQRLDAELEVQLSAEVPSTEPDA